MSKPSKVGHYILCYKKCYPNFIYSDFIPNPTLSRITSHSFEHSNNCHNDLTFLMNLYYRPTISSVLTMADGGPWQRATEPKPCSNTRHMADMALRHCHPSHILAMVDSLKPTIDICHGRYLTTMALYSVTGLKLYYNTIVL